MNSGRWLFGWAYHHNILSKCQCKSKLNFHHIFQNSGGVTTTPHETPPCYEKYDENLTWIYTDISTEYCDDKVANNQKDDQFEPIISE